MTDSNPLCIPITDLLRRIGAQRAVRLHAPAGRLGAGAATVAGDTPVDVDVVLERLAEGVVVRGRIEAPWTAECSRCLNPAHGTVRLHVDELFEPRPVPGETYLLGPESIDLEPLVRDAVVLELPPAPLCRDDCAGLCPSCGADRNQVDCDCTFDDTDPRWAALRSLER